MQISSNSFATFVPPVMVDANAGFYRTTEQFLKKGGFTSGLHYVRRAMMMLWVDYHRTGSAAEAIELLRTRIAPLKDIYELCHDKVCLSYFDMEYGLAAVLTADQTTIETFRTHAQAYSPGSTGYGFYTGFVGIIKGLLTENHQMQQEQRQMLEKLNPSKTFYWPSKAVIFATLDKNCAKLTANLPKIEQKFTGYAIKMQALDPNGNIDLQKLDLHFFCPYPDLAFYALAFRHCPSLFKKQESFWLPKALVEACGQQLVTRGWRT